MKLRCYSAAMAAGSLALCGMSPSANAASVMLFSDVTTLPAGFIPFDPTPNNTVGSYIHGETGDHANAAISPYDGTPFGPGGANDPYEVIGYGGAHFGSAPGAALFEVPTGTTTITILWGSPDPYNIMTFLTGACTTVAGCVPNGTTNKLVATYTGTKVPLVPAIEPPGSPDAGFNYVTFDVSGISSIVLTDTGKAAFEFANIEFSSGGNINPTPLPAALPLFAGRLGLLGLFVRKRRKAPLAA
jgi:hypothetical protein